MKCPRCGSRRIKEYYPPIMEEGGKISYLIEHVCKKCGGDWSVNEKGDVVLDNFEDKKEKKSKNI